MWLINLRALQFCSNLMDVTQVKDLVNRVKTFLQGSETMNVKDSTLVEITTVILVHGLSCHMSIEPTHQFIL